MKLKYYHLHEDYMVLVYPTYNAMAGEPIHNYRTCYFWRAVKMYFKYSKEYPNATIVFKRIIYK